jgi:hypothetical protein
MSSFAAHDLTWHCFFHPSHNSCILSFKSIKSLSAIWYPNLSGLAKWQCSQHATSSARVK